MIRFLIAGTGSGCGKTTVTCAILEALCQREMKIASFKCGPDYIDPMFHANIIGTNACNLDSFFCSPDTIRYLLTEQSKDCDAAVIEGVMGFYDGGEGSAFAISRITETPVILVIDCKGMSDSIGAIMHGFLRYKIPNRIAGFIFNRLPAALEGFARRLCQDMGTGYFGFLPPNASELGSRHLGLVTAGEVDDLKEKMQHLGALAEAHIQLDELLALPEKPVPNFKPLVVPVLFQKQPPVIAVAKDEAFCFHYAENLHILEQMGCELVYFSPLHDSEIPEADGLILSGGYPELYAEQLSQNLYMRRDVWKKINAGMPVIAECGGFLYLHRTLENDKGDSFPMTGVFEAQGIRTERLQRFGYLTMTAAEDTLICQKGESIRAHEFHYWDSTDCGNGFQALKKDGRSWECCHSTKRMYAGFPHLYFYSDLRIAMRFAKTCAALGGKHE